MKKDYKEMKYFKEYQYKSNIKETNKDFLNEIISFLLKTLIMPLLNMMIFLNYLKKK